MDFRFDHHADRLAIRAADPSFSKKINREKKMRMIPLGVLRRRFAMNLLPQRKEIARPPQLTREEFKNWKSGQYRHSIGCAWEEGSEIEFYPFICTGKVWFSNTLPPHTWDWTRNFYRIK
jgi:hypothetical protein